MSAVDAVDFLRAFSPDDYWDLISFPVEGGGPTAQQFAPTEGDKAAAWIDKQYEAGHNLYFHVNPNSAGHRKAKKSDVTEVRYLHVDLDPHEGEDWEEAQERITLALLDELPSGIKPPTFVVDSGNGYWGFWKLEEPIQLDGSPEAAEEAERFNRALEAAFEGDNCHNVDRVARLPGIPNRPGPKKRDAGRVTRETSVVIHRPDAVYPTAVFNKAPKQGDIGGGVFDTSGIKADVTPEEVTSFTGADTAPLKALGLDDLLISRILLGFDPVKHDGERPADLNRSDEVFHVAAALERHGIDDKDKAGILLNPDWAISEHCYAQKGHGQQFVAATRAIANSKASEAKNQANREAAHEEAMEDPTKLKAGEIPPGDLDLLLAWGNEKYAVLGWYGGKTVVLDLEGCGSTIKFMGVNHFKELVSCQPVHIDFLNASGKLTTKVMTFGEWWMKHPDRRTYHGTCFDTSDNPPADMYNLYRGFAVEPSNEGSCQLYMEHVRDNICAGDEASFEYLIKWMARTVQHPEKPGGAAIVLRGERGTGKGTFADRFMELFHEVHRFASGDGNMFVGEFTKHLDPVVVAFADEAIFAANRKGESSLKTLITESKRSSHGKGMTPTMEDNHISLIMASNSKWAVPTGPHERRYLVLDVSEERRQDNAYFEAINAEMRNGGYGALLHLLLSIDLADFDVYNAPKTAALQDQGDHSLSTVEDWWLDKLVGGRVFEIKSEKSWPSEVVFTKLRDDYLEHCKDVRELHPLGSVQLGHQLSSFGFPKSRATRRDGQQVRVYDLPSLTTLREAWDKAHGGHRDWSPMLDDDDQGPVF